MNEEFIEAVREIVGLVSLSEYQRDKLDDLYRETLATGIDVGKERGEWAERERCAKIAGEGCEREGEYGQGQCDWVLARIRGTE